MSAEWCDKYDSDDFKFTTIFFKATFFQFIQATQIQLMICGRNYFKSFKKIESIETIMIISLFVVFLDVEGF